MRILIIKLSSIGDVVHTLPSLHALRKGLGLKGPRKVEIDWLVEEAASSIVKDHPLIDNVIVVKNRGWFRGGSRNMATARWLASRKYDLVIDFQGLIKSGVWVMMSRGKRRVGFSNAREMSHLFLNEKLPPFDPDMHAVDRYLLLAGHAGGRVGSEGPVFPVHIGNDETERVTSLLRKHGIRPERFFALVPRARWATKLWGDKSFADFAKEAAERFDLDCALVGGPSDAPALRTMQERIGGRSASLAGMTDLRELAALMKLARFCVTVDSGPMHVAAAVGTRTVALFGPTAPYRTGPYGSGHVIITRGLDCSPCFKKKCEDPRCMSEIDVKDLLEAVEKIAGEEKTGRGRGGGILKG